MKHDATAPRSLSQAESALDRCRDLANRPGEWLLRGEICSEVFRKAWLLCQACNSLFARRLVSPE